MKSENLDKLLLSVSEVCKILSISRGTYFVLKAAGRIGPKEIKFGVKIYLRKNEIYAWVDAGCPSKNKWHWEK